MLMKFRFPVVIINVVIVSLVIAASVLAQNSTQNSGQNSASPAAATKRAVTEKDLFDFVWVANPQLSPDGSRVAFTRVSVDEKRTGYETSIWTVATSGGESPVRMTNGKHYARRR
jgi:Tol biopolymer transport system component